VGKLPLHWNWLADEYGESKTARLIHWTAGIPAWAQYKGAPMADVWRYANAKVSAAA
jgi:hypothetical protein